MRPGLVLRHGPPDAGAGHMHETSEHCPHLAGGREAGKGTLPASRKTDSRARQLTAHRGANGAIKVPTVPRRGRLHRPVSSLPKPGPCGGRGAGAPGSQVSPVQDHGAGTPWRSARRQHGGYGGRPQVPSRGARLKPGERLPGRSGPRGPAPSGLRQGCLGLWRECWNEGGPHGREGHGPTANQNRAGRPPGHPGPLVSSVGRESRAQGRPRHAPAVPRVSGAASAQALSARSASTGNEESTVSPGPGRARAQSRGLRPAAALGTLGSGPAGHRACL